MKKDLWITGIVPAVYTPMHEDGSINFDMIKLIVEHLLHDGVSALYVCGSTGEGPSLSTEERFLVTEAYIEAVADRLPIIVQVGHNSLKQAYRLAKHAQESGAAAISAVPPTYFKIGSLDVLLNCLGEITSGAPDLPFYYYHIPRLTAVQIDVVEFLRLGAQSLPTLHGVKYSTFTMWEFQGCVDLDDGRFNMLFGSDEMLLSGLVVGAHGAVGTTYNYAAPLYNRIIAAFKCGDMEEAKRLQGLSVQMIQPINKYGALTSNAPSNKAMMKLIGLDCGPMRLPQISLTPEKMTLLRQGMEAIGFFEWGR
ncbi:MAG: dihydrodipicolinate synthase family protein [Anaerolineales bacterium]|nr:dihydrodipicolinate synthase family protein [Anaerolineales bacterium]